MLGLAEESVRIALGHTYTLHEPALLCEQLGRMKTWWVMFIGNRSERFEFACAVADWVAAQCFLKVRCSLTPFQQLLAVWSGLGCVRQGGRWWWSVPVLFIRCVIKYSIFVVLMEMVLTIRHDSLLRSSSSELFSASGIGSPELSFSTSFRALY